MAKKKAIKKQKISKAVKKETKPKPKVKKMKTLVNTPDETVPTETVDNSTVIVNHDFLVNNELTGIYDGGCGITKQDGSHHVTVPGLVPYRAAGASAGMLLQIIYTGKDNTGNFKFVVNELEDGDPGYFKK